jgi:deoxyribodipyrimidine photo-lyase
MKLQVCWFRSDLRVDDNTALSRSLEKGTTLGIYIATPKQWAKHDDAAIKIDFWRRNLECLELALVALNIPFLTFEVADYSQVPQLMLQLSEQLDIAGLHFNSEYPLNESDRDKKVSRLLSIHGIATHVYHDQVLLPPASILNGSGQPFKVFTPYANKALGYLPGNFNCSAPPTSAQILPDKLKIPTNLTHQKTLNCIAWPALAASVSSITSIEPSRLWLAGESAAHKALLEFCESRIDSYQSQRDIPSVQGTSRLSPYLAAGVISIRRCWNGAHTFSDGEGVQIWRKELLWRDFYKYITFHYSYVCKNLPWRDKAQQIKWRTAPADFECWCNGQTGIPLIDAAMKQLLNTGWMHNRLRMVTAMFLSKQLLIDWRKGERWFMQHLIDGDFSANNGGWQWASSTGTDAAPYFRIFNPIRQSERFDPHGKFIRQYLPELSHLEKKHIHMPGDRMSSYPQPIVDLQLARQRALLAFKEVY